VESATVLAELLPVQLINADTFLLLEGGPGQRRQFIDWGGFHAEPQFMAAWKGVRRCLKQRNSLLKHGRIEPSVRVAWDHELVVRSEQLDRYRRKPGNDQESKHDNALRPEPRLHAIEPVVPTFPK